MTATVNTVTLNSILSSPYGPLSSGMGVIVLVLLLLLLLERVLLEAFLGKPATKTLIVFDIAVYPLLIIFCFLIGLRIANLLGFISS